MSTIQSTSASITIRLARHGDSDAIRRLAQLDSRPEPPGPILLAEVDGELWAAASTATGFTVADPFRPSAGAAEMLRARIEQLGSSTALTRRSGLFSRLVPQRG